MSDSERVQEYLDKHAQLKDERTDMQGQWEKITRYVLPSRDAWEDDANAEPAKRGREISDGRAVKDAQTMANGFIGWNAGPAVKWMKLRLLIDELNDMVGVKDWLEICEKRVYIMFHRSNFYDALAELYLDLVTIGTGTMLIEESAEDFTINYSTRHPKESYLIEGTNDKVQGLQRDVWLTGRNALERYGHDLKDETYDRFVDEPQKKYRFLHVIHPRSDRRIYSGLSVDMAYASVELYPDDETILRESGYDEFPAIVGRWRKNSNSPYGWSPAMDALTDITRANEVKKTMIDVAHRAAEPILNIPQEMSRRLNLSPLGANVYKTPDRRIFPTELGSGYPLADNVLEQLHEIIDEHFMVPLFMMLQRLERDVTATEIVERQGERIAGMAGPLNRQNSEILGPAVLRTFKIMWRAGMLPPPPAALLTTGAPLDVEFTGLLSQAQRRYQQGNSMNAGLATISGLVQMTQSIGLLDNLDMDDMTRKIAEESGFPASSIAELPEVKKKRMARQKQIEEQKQLEQLQVGADATNKLAKAPEPGSPGEQIAAQMAGAGGG